MNLHTFELESLFIGDKEFIISECNVTLKKNTINIENKKNLDLFCFLPLMERPIQQEFLFCKGKEERGKESIDISLYDCYVSIVSVVNNIIKEICIVYNQMLIGHHIENCHKIKINHMECILENDCNIKIWKNDFWEPEDFKVKTKVLKNKQIQITIDSNGKTLNEIFDILNNIISIAFWGNGYFLNKKEIYITINDKKCKYVNSNISLLETKKFIDTNGILVSEYENWDIVYCNWKKLYNKNKMLIHLFWSIPCTKFEEVKTFNYIQCLESLFSNNIIPEEETLSLREKVKRIFEYESSKKIFERESQEGLLKNIKKSTYNHRNAIAHIDSQKSIFKKEDNRTIQLKFALLFRVAMLNLLKIKYDNSKLQYYIKYLDSKNFFRYIKK